MIKLRGVNVFPEAVGALVAAESRSTGEFICVVERVGAAGQDEMTVMVEAADNSVDRAKLQADLQVRFREALSVKLLVNIVSRGELDPLTGLSKNTKANRLLDKRKS